MSVGTLLIRADASVAIGTGHVMRCLALGQAWQDVGGRVVFAMAERTDAIQNRLSAESCEIANIASKAGTVEDAAQTIALASQQNSEWIVVDGYSFTAKYQADLKSAACKVLFLDDYAQAQRYSADLILNQNVSANAVLYTEREPRTRLLLGTRYCLLRREFGRWQRWQREISPVCNDLLVLMGGSDPESITARTIEAFVSTELKEMSATVVIGGSNPNSAAMGKLAAKAGKITVRRNVSDIGELMAAADLAISAAGTTCWELCLLGLPMLLVDVAENQTEVAKELDRRGCAIRVGDWSVRSDEIACQLKRVAASQELRQSLSRRSRELVDGKGAARVVSVLRGPQGLRVRRARADDVQLLWKWANDPEVRAASFSSTPIPWETHIAWFAEKFDKSIILIAEDDHGIPLGQVRFDLNGCEADLNISLAKEKRGFGLAVPVIEAAMSELFANRKYELVHAFVKPENAASARAFEQAGFRRIGMEQVRGNSALHFVHGRN